MNTETLFGIAVTRDGTTIYRCSIYTESERDAAIRGHDAAKPKSQIEWFRIDGEHLRRFLRDAHGEFKRAS